MKYLLRKKYKKYVLYQKYKNIKNYLLKGNILYNINFKFTIGIIIMSKIISLENI